jgi:hypothetical protein
MYFDVHVTKIAIASKLSFSHATKVSIACNLITCEQNH